MTNEQIYNNLPSSWADMTLKTYIRYMSIEMEYKASEDVMEEVERELRNIYRTISVLSGAPIGIVQTLQPVWINKMAAKLAFLSDTPVPNKTSSIEWKKPDEVSYDAFITYVKIVSRDLVFDYMPLLIKLFSKTEKTEDEILNMNMEDVHSGFFLLMKQVKSYYQKQKRLAGLKLAKQAFTEFIHSKLKWSRKNA